jgi:glycosyltransferase involved in cell wall biosynthesis
LTDALAADGRYRVILLSQGVDGSQMLESQVAELDRRVALTDSSVALRAGWPIRKLLHEAVERDRPVLLHDHGIWMPNNHHVAAAARRHGLPLVIHPHGMLEPWALRYKAWKKRVAMLLYQHRDLRTAALFVATADQEADSIRRLGLRQPIAVIPNGVDFPVDTDRLESRRNDANGRRIALFLSRIHPKKGLLNLVNAWSKVRPAGWKLYLAGPDEGGHLSTVMRRVAALGLTQSIEYKGVVQGEEKERLWQEVSLFVLPSFSENFGLVVAEALARGVPVITTRETPWRSLDESDCGWWIDATLEALAVALSDAVHTDDDRMQAMGNRARILARRFHWEKIAAEMADVYRWLCSKGPMPNCVRLR